MAHTKPKKRKGPHKKKMRRISRKEEFLALTQQGKTESEIREQLLRNDTDKLQKQIEEMKKRFKSEMLYANYMTEHALDKDFVIGQLLTVYGRATQAEPVLDKEGAPTGEYKADLRTALKAVELLGKEIGMFKNSMVIEDVSKKERAQELIEEFQDVIEIKAEKSESKPSQGSDKK